LTELLQQFRWRPEIGDSSLLGWITTAAYALAAITACAAARRAARAPGLAGGSRLIWLLVTALMLFLGLNKQLDLQSLLTDIGRILSWKLGFHEQRREFQKWFVIGVLAASSLGALAAVIWCRGFWRSHFLLISGLSLLLVFIVLRAVSIHHLDALIGWSFENVGRNELLELVGVILIWLAALRDYRNPRKAPMPAWKPAD
jgi:hypothetical protein